MTATSRFADLPLPNLDLLGPGMTILVAVSGGPDSVYLLHGLLGLRDRLGLRLEVGHFNHGLRRTADRDERFVRDLATSFGLPFHVGRADLRSELLHSDESPEALCRRHRHAFLRQTAQAIGARRIALGHTRDDLVETVLLRLLAGTGPEGLTSLRPLSVDGLLVRPLLGLTKREILAELRRRRIPFVQDESNRNLRIPRNLLRHKVLPLLRRRYKEFDANLLRFVRILSDESDLIGRLLADLTAAGPVTVTSFRGLPTALQRRLLHSLLPHLGFEPLEAIRMRLLDLATENALLHADGHGRLEVRHDTLLALPPEELPRPFRVELHPDKPAVLPELGLVFRLSAQPEADASSLGLDPSGLSFPLVLRSRRPGDRFVPAGMAGRRKLQDHLTDLKVPATLRDRVVVVESAGTVVAVIASTAEPDRPDRVAASVRPAEGRPRLYLLWRPRTEEAP